MCGVHKMQLSKFPALLCSLSRQNMSDDDIRLGEEMRTDPNLDFSLLEKLGEG